MKKKLTLLIIFLLPSLAFSQETLLFKPLTANVHEPRIGAFYQFSKEKLRLDIGTSLDLYNFEINTNQLSIGADFFTFTRLRTDGNFKFPVETTDFFFGVNLNWVSEENLSGRFRLAHISSHLSDGFAKDSIFFKTPFVFSREFFDLTFAYKIIGVRTYLGLNYIFSTIPKDVNLLTPQIGFDYEQPLSDLFSIVCGYDFKLLGINDIYQSVNSAQAGIKLNTSEKIGLLLNLYFYQGRSMHGLFYKDIDSYLGLGFQIVFF